VSQRIVLDTFLGYLSIKKIRRAFVCCTRKLSGACGFQLVQ
jgi:hypothetical protein